MRLGGEAFLQRGGESRFADTGLAGKEHHLAFTGLCSCPASQQQFEFFVAPDEDGQAARVQRLETAFRRTRPQRRPGPRRFGDALEVLCPEVLQLKQITEKFSRGLGNDHHVRLGDALQARRQVRRLADDAALLSLPRSDQVADHDQAGRNADTGLQGSIRFERTDGIDQLQSRPHGPLRIILVSLRIAEIH